LVAVGSQSWLPLLLHVVVHDAELPALFRQHTWPIGQFAVAAHCRATPLPPALQLAAASQVKVNPDPPSPPAVTQHTCVAVLHDALPHARVPPPEPPSPPLELPLLDDDPPSGWLPLELPLPLLLLDAPLLEVLPPLEPPLLDPLAPLLLPLPLLAPSALPPSPP
jgi:hypothetical protein